MTDLSKTPILIDANMLGDLFGLFDGNVEDLARSSGLTIAEFLDEITKDRKILSSADFITELNGAGGG